LRKTTAALIFIAVLAVALAAAYLIMHSGSSSVQEQETTPPILRINATLKQSDLDEIISFLYDNESEENATGTEITPDVLCQRNFTLKSPENNVIIRMTETSGSVDVMLQGEYDGYVVCQNGTPVADKSKCLPKGLMEFLRKPFKIGDLVRFRCTSGLVTDTVEDCFPVYGTGPPEEYFTIMCQHSNRTIPNITCEDRCYVDMIEWSLKNRRLR
jgi:hypothetical protein